MKNFYFMTLFRAFSMETEPPSQNQWREKGAGFGKARESCAICLHSMAYCLSLFCHITRVMSIVLEYVHSNWLLL